MLKCSTCKQDKDESQFRINRSKKRGHSSYCIPCEKERQRQHYLKNKSVYIKRAHEFGKKKADWWREYKKTLKCKKCPENHPACLQCHHTDPSKKEVAISQVVRFWSLTRIMRELEKCEILCANCHAKEHWVDK